MKHLFLLALILPTLLIAQTTWDGTVDSTWYISDKEATSYTITTAAQLAGLATVVNRGTNFSGKTITLGANIILNDTNAQGGWRNWNSSTIDLRQWAPIGNSSNMFYGSFDGNGKLIIGLYISRTSDYQGLFGCIRGNISNLGVAGFYVKGGGAVGSVVGSNRGTIVNSYAVGNVSGTNYVGGVVGNNDSGTIANSYAVGSVSGDSRVGGVVGNNTSGTIANSYAVGSVSGTSYVGGVVGSNNGAVSYSYYNSDSATASNLNQLGSPKATTEMQTSAFCDTLQIYANVSNTINADNNFMSWIYNTNGYPSLSST
ncbi:MAG: hypothetical protein FWC26_11145 [Fibromonadales bacterium]|nr:hypothetical protein [Fibromonadales bacterium]